VTVSSKKRSEERSLKIANSSRLSASSSSVYKMRWNRSVRPWLRRDVKSVNISRKCFPRMRDKELRLRERRRKTWPMTSMLRKSTLVCLISKRKIVPVSSRSARSVLSSL